MRPFRFLADVRDIVDGKTLAANARRAEAMGFSVLVIPDHLIEQLAPIPAMATIAAATDRIRISAFVFNNDLRHPAVLAQDLASLDVLSEGRLEIAMGAGWPRPEYDAIGLPFEPQAVRSARLEEAVAVLKGCFAEGPFSFQGDHYAITEHDGYPKPVQRPHPPVLHRRRRPAHPRPGRPRGADRRPRAAHPTRCRREPPARPAQPDDRGGRGEDRLGPGGGR